MRETAPKESASTIWPMTGESMVPTLPEGQRVLIRLGRRNLERGDLILFRLGRDLVVHRLLGEAVSPDGRPCLRTRGDGRQFFDPPVDREMVEGRVIAIEADGAWWDLRGAGAKIYALGVALHDFCWTLVSLLARRVRIGFPLLSWAWRMDRALLAFAHSMLFRRLHARSQSPPTAG